MVTGGSKGIGRAICEVFSAQGYKVTAPSRGELDLVSSESVERWAAKNKVHFDILVNNAGVNPVSPLREFSLRAWSEALAVNLTGPMLLTKHVGASMCDAGWGRIVNVSSCYSYVAREGRSAYGAAKAGLNALTRSAALEFSGYGVLVNGVCPGFAETEMTQRNNTPEQIEMLAKQIPLGRLAKPEEVARLVLFLASAENTYITGQTVVVDGGFLLR